MGLNYARLRACSCAGLLALVVASSGCGDNSPSEPPAKPSAQSATSVRDASVQNASSTEQPDDKSLREAAAEYWSAMFRGDAGPVGDRATARCRDFMKQETRAFPAAIEGAPQSEIDKAAKPSSYQVRGLTKSYGEVARVGDTSWEPWRYEDGGWKSDGCEGGSEPPADATEAAAIQREPSVETDDFRVDAASIRFGTEQYGSRPWAWISLDITNTGAAPLEATSVNKVLQLAVTEAGSNEDVTGSGQACLTSDDLKPYGLWCSQDNVLTAPSDTMNIPAGATGTFVFDGPDPSTTQNTDDLLLRVDGTPIELGQN